MPLILASAVFNFFVGRGLARFGGKRLLFIGVAGNLLLLGIFKYTAFLLGSFGWLTGISVPQVDIPLPIGISFYTFTQIAFLVDAYRKEAAEYEPLKYGLFVTYFPHLIAGPILHHKEMMPQFSDPETFRPRFTSLVHGLAWFSAGLFKKVMLADSIAAFVEAPMVAAAKGSPVCFGDAWTGVRELCTSNLFRLLGLFGYGHRIKRPTFSSNDGRRTPRSSCWFPASDP